MPITPLHLPFVLLLLLMVAAPVPIALVIHFINRRDTTPTRILAGALGASIGIVVYQIAYLPVLVILLIFLAMLPPSVKAVPNLIVLSLLFIFYILWFFVLVLGYVSGFRVGLRLASGQSLAMSVRADLFLTLFRGRARNELQNDAA